VGAVRRALDWLEVIETGVVEPAGEQFVLCVEEPIDAQVGLVRAPNGLACFGLVAAEGFPGGLSCDLGGDSLALVAHRYQ
jgi:hypothetical protein